jgi:hypothetical protein
MIDDFDETIAVDRRQFVKRVGVAVLAVHCLPWIAHASGTSPGEGNDTADNLIIRSGPGLMSHVHDLLIPHAALDAPPLQGVTLETTQALLHRHSIALTREQLIVVRQGGTVARKASSHIFVIALANGRSRQGSRLASRR